MTPYICVMKSHVLKTLFLTVLVAFGMKPLAGDEVELICVRKQHSTKACHYNFVINGIPYRYIDHGCKATKETLIKKAQEGKLALAREWKIDCLPQKEGTK